MREMIRRRCLTGGVEGKAPVREGNDAEDFRGGYDRSARSRGQLSQPQDCRGDGDDGEEVAAFS